MKKKSLKKSGRKKISGVNVVGYLFCGLIALVCLIPFIMVLAASFTSEEAISLYGFSLWPKEFSLEAYKAVFKSPAVVAKAYLVTITLTLAGTAIGLLLQTMTAYVLSRRDFEWRSGFSFFFYFTTLFNGGLVSIYILMPRYLGLKNSYLALLLPLLFNVYNLLIMKSYMLSVPESLIDAAKIDGCGDFMMLFQVVMPLVRPALATVGLFIALAYWNDWYNAMLYISDSEMFPLQYFLYEQINNIQAYRKILSSAASGAVAAAFNLPTQSLKMALTVVATGPIVFAYPFVQKYFVQGITIGAVKG